MKELFERNKRKNKEKEVKKEEDRSIKNEKDKKEEKKKENKEGQNENIKTRENEINKKKNVINFLNNEKPRENKNIHYRNFVLDDISDDYIEKKEKIIHDHLGHVKRKKNSETRKNEHMYKNKYNDSKYNQITGLNLTNYLLVPDEIRHKYTKSYLFQISKRLLVMKKPWRLPKNVELQINNVYHLSNYIKVLERISSEYLNDPPINYYYRGLELYNKNVFANIDYLLKKVDIKKNQKNVNYKNLIKINECYYDLSTFGKSPNAMFYQSYVIWDIHGNNLTLEEEYGNFFDSQIIDYAFGEKEYPNLKYIISICSSILLWLNFNKKDNFAIINYHKTSSFILLIFSCVMLSLDNSLTLDQIQEILYKSSKIYNDEDDEGAYTHTDSSSTYFINKYENNSIYKKSDDMFNILHKKYDEINYSGFSNYNNSNYFSNIDFNKKRDVSESNEIYNFNNYSNLEDTNFINNLNKKESHDSKDKYNEENIEGTNKIQYHTLNLNSKSGMYDNELDNSKNKKKTKFSNSWGFGLINRETYKNSMRVKDHHFWISFDYWKPSHKRYFFYFNDIIKNKNKKIENNTFRLNSMIFTDYALCSVSIEVYEIIYKDKEDFNLDFFSDHESEEYTEECSYDEESIDDTSEGSQEFESDDSKEIKSELDEKDENRECKNDYRNVSDCIFKEDNEKNILDSKKKCINLQKNNLDGNITLKRNDHFHKNNMIYKKMFSCDIPHYSENSNSNNAKINYASSMYYDLPNSKEKENKGLSDKTYKKGFNSLKNKLLRTSSHYNLKNYYNVYYENSAGESSNYRNKTSDKYSRIESEESKKINTVDSSKSRSFHLTNKMKKIANAFSTRRNFSNCTSKESSIYASELKNEHMHGVSEIRGNKIANGSFIKRKKCDSFKENKYDSFSTGESINSSKKININSLLKNGKVIVEEKKNKTKNKKKNKKKYGFLKKNRKKKKSEDKIKSSSKYGYEYFLKCNNLNCNIVSSYEKNKKKYVTIDFTHDAEGNPKEHIICGDILILIGNKHVDKFNKGFPCSFSFHTGFLKKGSSEIIHIRKDDIDINSNYENYIPDNMKISIVLDSATKKDSLNAYKKHLKSNNKIDDLEELKKIEKKNFYVRNENKNVLYKPHDDPNNFISIDKNYNYFDKMSSEKKKKKRMEGYNVEEEEDTKKRKNSTELIKKKKKENEEQQIQEQGEQACEQLKEANEEKNTLEINSNKKSDFNSKMHYNVYTLYNEKESKLKYNTTNITQLLTSFFGFKSKEDKFSLNKKQNVCSLLTSKKSVSSLISLKDFLQRQFEVITKPSKNLCNFVNNHVVKVNISLVNSLKKMTKLPKLKILFSLKICNNDLNKALNFILSVWGLSMLKNEKYIKYKSSLNQISESHREFKAVLDYNNVSSMPSEESTKHLYNIENASYTNISYYRKIYNKSVEKLENKDVLKIEEKENDKLSSSDHSKKTIQSKEEKEEKIKELKREYSNKDIFQATTSSDGIKIAKLEMNKSDYEKKEGEIINKKKYGFLKKDKDKYDMNKEEISQDKEKSINNTKMKDEQLKKVDRITNNDSILKRIGERNFFYAKLPSGELIKLKIKDSTPSSSHDNIPLLFIEPVDESQQITYTMSSKKIEKSNKKENIVDKDNLNKKFLINDMTKMYQRFNEKNKTESLLSIVSDRSTTSTYSTPVIEASLFSISKWKEDEKKKIEENRIEEKEIEKEEIKEKRVEEKEIEKKEIKEKRVEEKEIEEKRIEEKEVERKEIEEKESEKREIEKKEAEEEKIEDKEGEKREIEKKEAEEEKIEDKEGEKRGIEKKETEEKRIEEKESEKKEIEKKKTEEKKNGEKEVEKKESEEKDIERKEYKLVNDKQKTANIVEALLKKSKEKRPPPPLPPSLLKASFSKEKIDNKPEDSKKDAAMKQMISKNEHTKSSGKKIPCPPPFFLNKNNMKDKSKFPLKKCPLNFSLKKSEKIPEKRPLGIKLHWQLLPTHKIEGTVFNEIKHQEAKYNLIDTKAVHKIFARAKTEKKVIKKKESEEKKKNSEEKLITVLDRNRAQNIGILLRFPMSTQEIVDKINVFDLENMNIEFLQKVLHILPTKEESDGILHKLQNENVKPEQFRDVERKLIPFVYLDKCRPKFEISLFSLKYEKMINEIKNDLVIYDKAVKEVRSSIRLRSLLKAVLKWGNYVNYGINDNEDLVALGFTLSSVLKLSEFKSSIDSSITSLHYITVVLCMYLPNLNMNWLENDLESVLVASKMSSEAVDILLISLDKEINYIKTQLKSNYEGIFKEKMVIILEDSEKKFIKVQKMYEETKKCVYDLSIYLGEEISKSGNLENIFIILSSIVDNFTKCYKDILSNPKKYSILLNDPNLLDDYYNVFSKKKNNPKFSSVLKKTVSKNEVLKPEKSDCKLKINKSKSNSKKNDNSKSSMFQLRTQLLKDIQNKATIRNSNQNFTNCNIETLDNQNCKENISKNIIEKEEGNDKSKEVYIENDNNKLNESKNTDDKINNSNSIDDKINKNNDTENNINININKNNNTDNKINENQNNDTDNKINENKDNDIKNNININKNNDTENNINKNNDIDNKINENKKLDIK
ncbi:formin 2, putative [Plasmodium relictum]|uniref:Formin 2, putative n=1 Tax=Plasmodium relictum TaxID=85471 RepID=A0A1J1HEY3_PLARL|nr:formin 2, putative [Plasmodium relictum]CRH02618.1 formin 2, putative [Plasmodium relictum]